jgi:hypothetical protein
VDEDDRRPGAGVVEGDRISMQLLDHWSPSSTLIPKALPVRSAIHLRIMTVPDNTPPPPPRRRWMPPPRPESVVDRRIREAQERGDFSKLKGSGRPLSFGHEPAIDRDSWVVNQVLKNAGMVPVWMELAKEIDRIDDLLAALATEHGEMLTRTVERLAPLPESEWQAEEPGIAALHRRYLARIQGMLIAKQRLVARFNLIVPARFLEKVPVTMERDLPRYRVQFRECIARFGWRDVEVPEPIPFDVNEPDQPMSLFDDGADNTDSSYAMLDPRRARLVEVNRKLQNRKPKKGLPLDWLARMNPLGHAAELLRNQRHRWTDGE